MLRLRLSAAEPDRPYPKSRRLPIAFEIGGAATAYGRRSGEEVWVDVPDIAIFRASAGETALTASPCVGAATEAVTAAYYDTALPFALQATRDVEVLHGSAVLSHSDESVAVFSGSTECGKSTVAYGLALRGHGLWADDCVAFQLDDGGSARSVGLPFAVKLREASAAHFAANGSGNRVEPSSFEGASAPLGSVFLLEPVDEKRIPAANFERLEPGDALGALLPNAYRFRPAPEERRRQTMTAYLELVASVPVWRVRYPRVMDRLSDLLSGLESHMATR
jgi:hypothetical protein